MATSYNPLAVMFNQGSMGNYLKARPVQAQPPAIMQQQGAQSVGPQGVRAIGAGPYDPAYRQNLADYAMGQFSRPGTNFAFDPTGPLNFGQPTGGGNAPVLGMPQTLLGQALGGQGVQPGAPQQQQAPQQQGGNFGGLQSWLEQFMGGFQLPGMGGSSGF